MRRSRPTRKLTGCLRSSPRSTWKTSRRTCSTTPCDCGRDRMTLRGGRCSAPPAGCEACNCREGKVPDKVKILEVGLGDMSVSHAKAYHKLDGFEIVGLMSRTIKSHELPEPISGYPRFENFEEALAETKPDAVSINTWPNTHAEYALKAIEAGCHVFMEKPLATNIEDAEKVVAAARAKNR